MFSFPFSLQACLRKRMKFHQLFYGCSRVSHFVVVGSFLGKHLPPIGCCSVRFVMLFRLYTDRFPQKLFKFTLAALSVKRLFTDHRHLAFCYQSKVFVYQIPMQTYYSNATSKKASNIEKVWSFNCII